MSTYEQFLETKKKTAIKSGFEVKESDLPDYLFPFQKFCVKRSLLHGKYAILSGTGSGKTRMCICYAQKVSEHTNKPVLILTNLSISGQFVKEGKKIGVLIQKLKDALPVELGGNNDLCNCDQGIYVCNYEQLDAIADYISLFSGVVCDESSILANYEGKTKAKLIDLFKNTPYKLCASATPGPNNAMEMGNHAEFLDVMSRNEMLAMFFIHDGGNTSQWRLKGHAEDRFYEWIASWCVMFDRPGDIGFDNTGYDLPPLNINEIFIPVPLRNNGMLFNDTAVNATTYNAELRLTMEERMNKVAEIVNSKPDENFIIWIKHNNEADYLKKLLIHAVEVRGDDTPEYKEEMLLGFAENKFKILITKTRIASMGLNYQNCNNEIFASPDFSFKDLYQGIRRIWRFGQKIACNIWILLTETMQNIGQLLKEKEINFKTMLYKVTASVIKHIDEEKKQVSDYIEIKLPSWLKSLEYKN